MQTSKLLAENIVALTLLQALTHGAPLLTVPYLVRVLIALRRRGFPVWNSELSRGWLVPVKSEA